jgi:hypothetical protein
MMRARRAGAGQSAAPWCASQRILAEHNAAGKRKVAQMCLEMLRAGD